MISATLEGRLPYMTYPEPWRGQPKQQPPEFLRPAPKPIVPTNSSRYNGINTSPTSSRLSASNNPQSPSQRKYPSPTPPPPTSSSSCSSTPVNLTQSTQQQVKDDILAEDHPTAATFNPYRLYQQSAPTHFSPYPPHFFYPNAHNPYQHISRPTYPTTPLPPLENYSPTTPTAITSAAYLPGSVATFSPTSLHKNGNIINNSTCSSNQTNLIIRTNVEKRSNSIQQQQQQSAVAFKVPSGKEGSLKHRILTRPEDGIQRINNNNNNHNNNLPLDLHQKNFNNNNNDIARRISSSSSSTMSPPRSPSKKSTSTSSSSSTTPNNTINNNNTILENFAKGSLIQLTNGDLKRIEDMRTEDFVSSAESCPELKLVESTVVKIGGLDYQINNFNQSINGSNGMVTISLSYNQTDRRTQVNVQVNVEHPFFVFGKGWSSCNPDLTQKYYRLKVHRLQVGDILISLTPREQTIKQKITSNNSHSNNKSTSPIVAALPSTIRNNSSNTIMTTATSTAMSIRQVVVDSNCNNSNSNINNSSVPKNYRELINNYHQPMNLHTPNYAPSISPDSLAAARKRRWSAPDEICDEEEQQQQFARKLKLE